MSRPVGSLVGAALRPALRARGFAAADIIGRWPAIVGDLLAQHTAPERLTWPSAESGGATLRIRVAPGFAPQVQHLAHLIIERINTFFGYRALARLTLVQGPLPRRTQTRTPKRELLPEERARLDELLAGVRDAKLKESLMRLGAALIAAT